MRLLSVLLGVLVAGSAHADAIKARIKFEGPGFASMGKEAQLAAVNTVSTRLQATLAKQFKLTNFESGPIDNGLYVALMGKWAQAGIPDSAAEDMRAAAMDAASAAPAAKLALTDFRIEVDDGHKIEIEREIDNGRQQEKANREKARPQPRLNIEVKDKLFEDLTILEVPLVRVMDRLGAAMPFAYVLHPEVVGRAVFVRLLNVTLDEALAAIAESAQVKIERREKYIAIVPLPPTK